MTVHFLSPNGTIGVTGAVVGAANAHSALSDSNNATYVTCDDGEGARVDLTSYTLAADEIVVGVQVLCVAQAVGADVAIAYAYIDTAGGTYPYGAATLSATAFASVTTHTGPFLQRAFTQSELDELTLSVAFQKITGAGTQVQFMEGYVGVLVASPPTVVVTAPSGAQSTPTPTVAWTFTAGADGGAQSYARVKVFSAAQYGAGGFDPSTSTATYDSGTITGAGTSHTLSSSLANSTTWRAYVQVAHTINSTTAWSAWAYSGFTTSYTTADVASVSVTPSNSAGKITVTANRDTGTHAWATVDIERSLDAGTTWSAVRGATASTATNTWVTAWGSNAVTVVDYEVPNGTAVVYRARGNWVNSGVTVTGPWTSSASTSWTSDDVWLKCPLDPTLNVVVEFSGDAPTLTYGVEQGIFHPTGRTTAVVVSDVRQAATGDLGLETLTFTAAATLKDTFDATVLLLQMPEEIARDGVMNLYVVCGPLEEAQASVATEWTYWRTSFTVVDAPADTA